MPGHKRNPKFNIMSSQIDITEIEGFDNLHSPTECLLEIENKYSRQYDSLKSIISVNGSTCCILSTICAVCDYGDKIIIARNCHKSVYNACYLKRLKVEYIYPSINVEFNNFNAITQNQIDEAIKQNSDAKAIVITSPTYEGIISNIKSPIPLIIDAAHGAHFGFNEHFPQYPKADIVVSSLHKTLPALTQTAIVNIYNSKYINDVKKFMDIFESSSPSYVLMNSIDICSDFLANSNDDFENLYKYANELIDKIQSNLTIFKVINSDDISRLCIKSTKLSGNELAGILREKYKIEVEMSCSDYIILILTVGDEKAAFTILYDALKDINDKYHNHNDFNHIKVCDNIKPTKQCESYEIVETEVTNINDSINKVSAEFIYAYPPGIPIITPGEIISKEIIDYINVSKQNGTNIISDSGVLSDKILTKRNL